MSISCCSSVGCAGGLAGLFRRRRGVMRKTVGMSGGACSAAVGCCWPRWLSTLSCSCSSAVSGGWLATWLVVGDADRNSPVAKSPSRMAPSRGARVSSNLSASWACRSHPSAAATHDQERARNREREKKQCQDVISISWHHVVKPEGGVRGREEINSRVLRIVGSLAQRSK